jgi:hypothetical protein
MSTWICVAIMVVGFIGMIVCSKKQKTNPAMQPVAILLCVVVLGAAGYLLFQKMGFNSSASVMESELAFLASRGHAAGVHLQKVAPGKKILVIAEPNYDKSPQTQNLIDMIKKGYGSEDVTVEALVVPGASAENAMPIEELMKAKDFDAVLNKHKDAGIIISLVGLPQNAARMAAFRSKNVPVFFLMSIGMGTGKFVSNQLEKGVVAGVIVPNPKADYEAKAPSDPAKAFAIRFVLVTKENLAAYKQFFE